MTATTGVAFTRVTVVAPTRRFDLALPSDVAFADLLPTLLQIAGEDPISGSATGWALHRLGQRPFDNQQSSTTYNVRDGEVLYLEVAEAAVREIVFDDVAEAIARNAKTESARWGPMTTRAFGVAAAGTIVALASLVCLFAGPSILWSGIAGGLAVLLLGTGILLSRAFGDSRIGALFGFTALPYAFIAGLFAPGEVATLGDLGNAHLLSGFITITLAAMVAMVGISDAVHLFLGTTGGRHARRDRRDRRCGQRPRARRCRCAGGRRGDRADPAAPGSVASPRATAVAAHPDRSRTTSGTTSNPRTTRRCWTRHTPPTSS